MLHPPGRCYTPGARDTADTGTKTRSSLILGENEAEESRPVWATYCKRCLSAGGGAHTHTVWLLELVSAVERKEGKSCVLIGVMAKNL